MTDKTGGCNMKKFIIDRFDGSYAICEMEDKSTTIIPKYKLPLNCREGDCLLLNHDGMYQKDNEVPINKNIKKRINKILNS